MYPNDLNQFKINLKRPKKKKDPGNTGEFALLMNFQFYGGGGESRQENTTNQK